MLDTLAQKLENAGLKIIDMNLQSIIVRDPQKSHEVSLSLQNLYKILEESDRSTHEKQLDHFVTQVCAHFAPTTQKKILYPLLSPDKEDKRLHAPWSAPLIPGQLRLLLGEEQGERLRLLSPMDIVRSGLSLRDLQKEAMDNLFTRSKDQKPSEDGIGNFRFEIGDGYDASRFLMIRHWFPSQTLWIAIPARDSLWIRKSPPDLVTQKSLQEAFQSLPYPLIPSWIQLPALSMDPKQSQGL